MGEVTFGIKGLAVIYRKERNDSWTIIFPTNKDHKARLFIKNEESMKNGSEDEYLNVGNLGSFQNIKIDSIGSIPPKDGVFQTTDFTESILDLTSEEFFGEGVQKNPDSRFTMGEKKIEIKHAVLSSILSQENRLNFVFPIDRPDEIKLLKKQDGSPKWLTWIVGGAIELEEEGKILIEIDGNQFLLKDGESFFIDNDCADDDIECQYSDKNDFQIYLEYYLSKDVDPITRKLRNGKFRRVEAISIYIPDEDIKLPTGNKDIATKPPPKICIPAMISNPMGLD